MDQFIKEEVNFNILSNYNEKKIENIDFDLHLDLVDFSKYYILSRASLGQIMTSFANINFTFSIKNNIYQNVLYQLLNIIIPDLICSYYKLLKCNSFIEKEVKFYHLIVNIPHNLEIVLNNHNIVNLGKPKIGELITAIKQRIDYILNKQIPILYNGKQSHIEEYNKLLIQLKGFKDNLLKFEKCFIDAISKARHEQQKYYYNIYKEILIK